MIGDQAGGAAVAAAGAQLTDDQIMADLLKIYYQELYVYEWRAEYNRRFRREAAHTGGHAWRRTRIERFLRAVEKDLLPTLQNQGWSQARASQGGYVAEFELVVTRWTSGRYQLAIPPPKSIDFDPSVIAQLPGGPYIGPQSGYTEKIRKLQLQRALQTLHNIASGPLGAAGYLLGGHAGSDVGALLDAVAGDVARTGTARSDFKSLAPPADQRAVAGLVETSPTARGLDTPRTGGGALSPKALIGPPPPAAATIAPTPPPAVSSQPARKSATGPERYSDTPPAKLKRLAKKDPEAAEALRLRYRNMDDRELRKKASRGDETARAILRQRTPSNEEDLRRAMESKRPPHSATAVARDSKGKIIWAGQLTSGNETAEEKALAPMGLATHTEWRAVRQAPLGPGVTLSISGQYDPCDFCRRAMQEAATRTGATIVYWWPGERRTGETMTFRP